MGKTTANKKLVAARKGQLKPTKAVKAVAAGVLSRGQRKRSERKIARMKKKELIDSHFSKTLTPAQCKLQEVAGLRLALEEAEKNNEPKKPLRVISAKTRKRVAITELGQLKAVHAHTQFKANAFGTLREHLINSFQKTQN